MKKLFKSNTDRELWIKLNAERLIEWEKGLTYFNLREQKYIPTLQALNPRSMESALKISRKQCKYDEERGELRFTLEELLTLDIDGLNAITYKKHQEWIKKLKELK